MREIEISSKIIEGRTITVVKLNPAFHESLLKCVFDAPDLLFWRTIRYSKEELLQWLCNDFEYSIEDFTNYIQMLSELPYYHVEKVMKTINSYPILYTWKYNQVITMVTNHHHKLKGKNKRENKIVIPTKKFYDDIAIIWALPYNGLILSQDGKYITTYELIKQIESLVDRPLSTLQFGGLTKLLSSICKLGSTTETYLNFLNRYNENKSCKYWNVTLM